MEETAASSGMEGTTAVRNQERSTMTGRSSSSRSRWIDSAPAPAGRPETDASASSTTVRREDSRTVRGVMPMRSLASAKDSILDRKMRGEVRGR